MKRVLHDAGTYDRVIGSFDRLGLAALRRRLVGPLRGAILEIGVGTGLTLPHYGPGAQVAGIEPEGRLLTGARPRARARGYALHRARGEALPFADRSFDVVVSTLVFCSIPAAALGGTLAEIGRVLRPGGRLIQLEHTRSGHRPLDALLDLIAPLWLRASGGCHVNRDPASLLTAAGWRIERHERHFGGLYRILTSTPAPVVAPAAMPVAARAATAAAD
jgi:SAM-dependent methyltransferase